MRYGAFATRARYRDLEVVIDYRTYDGEWTTWFEEQNWLKPRLKSGICACALLWRQDVRVRRQLPGTRLRVGEATRRPPGVLRVRLMATSRSAERR